MRLTREKLVHLSHVIIGGMEEAPGFSLLKDRNEVRLTILGVLQDGMRIQDEIDMTVRRKIMSQKKEIPEGSRDWDILYRKYYEEESSKYRRIR